MPSIDCSELQRNSIHSCDFDEHNQIECFVYEKYFFNDFHLII